MEDAYLRHRGRRASNKESKQRGNERTSTNVFDEAALSQGAKPETVRRLIRTRKRRKLRRRLLLIVVLLILLFVWLNLLFAKAAAAAAEKETERIAEQLINSAIIETLTECEKTGLLDNLTEQSVNGEGAGFLFIDAVKLNLIASLIIQDAGKKVEKMAASGISLPLGTISGAALLNGLGPELTAKIRPIGSLSRKFSSAFTDAGVNQTKYSAEAEISLTVLVLFGGRETIVTVNCRAPLVETVIVGGVPHAYTNVGTLDDALNLIPTDAE